MAGASVPATNKRGRLFVISAPSGAGKTTLCEILCRCLPSLAYSISYTTRPPRPGERDGIDYHFIDEKRFKQMIQKGMLAEWTEVYGNYYGTSAKDLESMLSAGKHILLDIDVKGARQIKARFPDAITIFIMPPSLDELAKRLKRRGTDSPETIKKRLEAATLEIKHKDSYDYVIVNDDLEKAASRLCSIVKEKIAAQAPDKEQDFCSTPGNNA